MLRLLLKFRLIFVVLLLLIFSLGCVYYNTFYNAKKAFETAERARTHPDKRKAKIDTESYRKAIEKSTKVIERHPNSKYYDDALFIIGVSSYYLEQYSSADRRLRELLANYPESEFVRESEIYLAKSKIRLRDNRDAMVYFEKIFNSDYEQDLKAEAAMALGNFYFEDKLYDESREYYQSVTDSLGSEIERRQAQRFIADSYFNQYRFIEAHDAYQKILDLNPNKDEKYYALYRSCESYFSVSNIEEGIVYLDQMIGDEIFFDSLSSMQLLYAEGLEILEDLDGAIELYEQIIDNDNLNNNISRAHYRLGLLYQFEMDNLPDAKFHYDKCIEISPNSIISRDALQRSTDIGKLDTFSRSISIDSLSEQEIIDDAAFTQYQLAELYWFSLNKPDSAITEMKYIVDSFPTAYDAPRAMIALSQMYSDFYGDTVLADSFLNLAIRNYPRSDIVLESLEELKLADSDFKKGYAKYYLDKAEYFIGDDFNYDSARYYYQYLVDNFPESQYYLQARFALIWIEAEYSPPGDSSIIKAYEAFIDTFPNTIWAEEALKITNSELFSQDYEEDSDDLSDSSLKDKDDLDDVKEKATVFDTTYMDPLEALYIDPEGNKAILIDEQPIEIKEPFEYPPEAFRQAWEGDIYFQILLDFSGEVTDYNLKIRSGIVDIDREASEAVESMTFDILRIEPEFINSWFVYKMVIKKPEHLR
jgi:TonB family protein